MSRITIFQRYHTKENQHTNSFMLLLQNFYNFYQEEFYKFIFQNNEVNDIVTFVQQEAGDGSVPDGEFIQQAIHVIVETKDSDWFYSDQLEAHTKKFKPNELKIFITLAPSYNKNSHKETEELIKRINERENTDIVYLPLTYDGAISQIQKIVDGVQVHNQFFDEMLADYIEYVSDENLHEPNTLWLKSLPSGTSFDEDFETGIIYRDGIKPYADINFIGGYKNKAVRSIGKLIDVVYREFNGAPIYKHKIVEDEGLQKEVESRIEDAISKSKYGADSLNRCVHTFFVTSGFAACDFVKQSSGGVLNARWFNLNEILNLQKEEIENMELSKIAGLLNDKTWE